MNWFKVHAEIIHDPKIRALAYEDRWHFVALMALMCDGTLEEDPDLRDELVSVALGLHGIDLEKAKARLMRLRLIGDDWKPRQWEKRQASTDPTAAERQRRRREAIRAEKGVTPLSRTCHGDVTRDVTPLSRIEEEEEEESVVATAVAPVPQRKRFIAPTVEEVEAHCRRTGQRIDAQSFVDFYASKGWVVGKSPMKSWEAAVSTWARRDQASPSPSVSSPITRGVWK